MGTMKIYDMRDRWNDVFVPFNAIKMNVTDSASSTASNLLSLQVDDSIRLKVDKYGSLVLVGPATAAGNPILDITQTWSNSAAHLTAVKLNVIDTASSSTSQLMDLQANSVSQYSVSKTGVVRAAGSFTLDNPINTQTTASYTLTLADTGRMIRMDTTVTSIVTVPAESLVNIPIGASVTVEQTNVGSVSFVAGPGVTLNSPTGGLTTNDQYALATLLKVDNDLWTLFAGAQGDIGFTGSQGLIGFTGSQGLIGFTGSQGLIGFTGSLGDIGFTGSRGDLGFTGSSGDVGFTGSQGDIGFTGSSGDVGFTGSQGDVGFTGSQGDIGFTGSSGDVGFTGSQGDVGFTGSQGIEGFTGSQGDIGFTGSQGIIGFTGSQGDIGFTGSRGLDVTLTAGTGTVGGGLLDQDRTVWLDTAYTDNLYVLKAGDTLSGFLSLHADPTDISHAATKRYVDHVAQGLRILPSAKAATTATLAAVYDNGTLGVGATLTAPSNSTFPTIDGVNVWSTGNNVLIKDQDIAAHNGSYVITDLGSESSPWILTRCGFCDEPDEIPGSFEFVTQGTLNGSTGWVASVTTATVVIGTTDINWIQFSGAGTYTAGDGLTLDGTEFNVNVDDSTIEINVDILRVKDSGITNAKLANSSITFAADTGTNHVVALGSTATIISGQGILTEITSGTVRISGQDASIINKGVASFGGWAGTDTSTRQFSLVNGDVSIVAMDGGFY